jgi:hypothetical protein
MNSNLDVNKEHVFLYEKIVDLEPNRMQIKGIDPDDRNKIFIFIYFSTQEGERL